MKGQRLPPSTLTAASPPTPPTSCKTSARSKIFLYPQDHRNHFVNCRVGVPIAYLNSHSLLEEFKSVTLKNLACSVPMSFYVHGREIL